MIAKSPYAERPRWSRMYGAVKRPSPASHMFMVAEATAVETRRRPVRVGVSRLRGKLSSADAGPVSRSGFAIVKVPRRAEGVVLSSPGRTLSWALMRRAVVCGAGGFIASHLVKRLK